MSVNSDPSKPGRTIHVHVVEIVKQKEEGYVVVIEVPSEADFTSEEVWQAALPGDYRGATKVDRLWHLYYGSDPGYSPGWLDITVPKSVEEG